VAIRFAVNVWLQGVSSPGWETLTNVAPEERRDQVRAFLNGGPAQVGTAIAGVIALVGERALDSRQLAAIGFAGAIVTVVLMWNVRRSYTRALVDAIRSGRPSVFDAPVRDSPVAVRTDAQAIALATAAMADADPRTRRLAAHLLSGADDARAARALRGGLRDVDPLVRAQAVEALAGDGQLEEQDARRALADDDARVRQNAVRAIPSGRLPPDTLDDDDPSVAVAAAVALLGGPSDAAAEHVVRRLLGRDTETRALVLRELGDAGAEAVARFVPAHLDDPAPAVRAAALEALAAAGAETAVPAALRAIASADPLVTDAALRTLDRLDPGGFEAEIAAVVDERSTLATRDGAAAAAIPANGEARELLRDALLARARSNALVALATASVGRDDRGEIRVALDALRAGDRSQLANALEAVESAIGDGRARSLLALWEPGGRAGTADAPSLGEIATGDPDPFIRACAELARSERGGDDMARSVRSLSPVELTLLLRRVPLLAALPPPDLERLAAIAEEASFADGDEIGAEGELGDELHLVLEGSVRVSRADRGTIARRAAGDVVGEMSLIRRAPRVATLLADGDVRTVRIGRREFEAMLRERPDIALAVLRVLANRLAALSGDAEPDPAS
jgi:HEAT repeat protein